jgi:hypothetical protein
VEPKPPRLTPELPIERVVEPRVPLVQWEALEPERYG